MLVCIAPDVATLQISELFTTTLGAFAVGTDLSVTTVLDTVFVSAPFALVIALTTNIKVKTTKSVFTSKLYKFLTILKLQ